MKTNDIKFVLMKSLYEKSISIFCTNFQAMGFSECDVLRITPSNIVYEYEIKTSRSDFKADFKKKYKHSRLSNTISKNNEYIKWSGHPGIPNYFTYVTPKNMVKISEIPSYAGLIYVDENEIEVIKKAPKLHSFKATEGLIRTVCNTLSTRIIYGGGSYIKFLKHKN